MFMVRGDCLPHASTIATAVSTVADLTAQVTAAVLPTGCTILLTIVRLTRTQAAMDTVADPATDMVMAVTTTETRAHSTPVSRFFRRFPRHRADDRYTSLRLAVEIPKDRIHNP